MACSSCFNDLLRQLEEEHVRSLGALLTENSCLRERLESTSVPQDADLLAAEVPAAKLPLEEISSHPVRLESTSSADMPAPEALAASTPLEARYPSSGNSDTQVAMSSAALHISLSETEEAKAATSETPVYSSLSPSTDVLLPHTAPGDSPAPRNGLSPSSLDVEPGPTKKKRHVISFQTSPSITSAPEECNVERASSLLNKRYSDESSAEDPSTKHRNAIRAASVWAPPKVIIGKKDLWAALFAIGQEFDVMNALKPEQLVGTIFAVWKSLATTMKAHLEFELRSEWVQEQCPRVTSALKTSPVTTDLFHGRTAQDQNAAQIQKYKASAAATKFVQDEKQSLMDLRFKFILSPTGSRRCMWDLSAGALLFFELFMLPLTFFSLEKNVFLQMMEWVSTVFWTCDMIMSCMTGYIHVGVVVKDPVRIFQHYAKTWLIPDLIVVIPEWVVTIIECVNGEGMISQNTGSSGKALKVLRMGRSIRILRVAKLQRLLGIIKDRIDSEALFIVINILKLIVLLLFMNHFICSIWYAIGNERDPSWITRAGLEHDNWVKRYLTAFHWSLTQFTPASMEVNPVRVPERAYAIATLMLGLVVFSSFVSRITSFTSQWQQAGKEQYNQYWILRRYLRQHQVSTDLTIRILSFIEKAWKEKRELIQESSVSALHMLSTQMRDELKFEVSYSCLNVHPLFARLHSRSATTFLRVVRTALSTSVFATMDTVFEPRIQACGMYIISSGELRYIKTEESSKTYSDDEIPYTSRILDSLHPFTMEHADSTPVHWCDLEKDDWASEHCLWTSWAHLGFLQALVVSTLAIVDVEAFAAEASQDSEAAEFVRNYAQSFVNKLNNMAARDLTDIFRHAESYVHIKRRESKAAWAAHDTSTPHCYNIVHPVGRASRTSRVLTAPFSRISARTSIMTTASRLSKLSRSTSSDNNRIVPSDG